MVLSSSYEVNDLDLVIIMQGVPGIGSLGDDLQIDLNSNPCGRNLQLIQ
jgi:hypothetical protein